MSREKGIQSPLSTPRGGLERERGRQVRTAGRRKVALRERERERGRQVRTARRRKVELRERERERERERVVRRQSHPGGGTAG